ncbi:MAG: Fic family protein [bacterium]
MKQFKHFDLRIVKPAFDSDLTDIIMALDHLRKKVLMGTTPPETFSQIKHIFLMLESIGSLRIEGNKTTAYEYIETKIDNKGEQQEEIKEIENIEKALAFIEKKGIEQPIDESFLKQLHKIVIEGLTKEGSSFPGEFRRDRVYIRNSVHVPPDYLEVKDYVKELINFINTDHAPKYSLLKTAIVHHRFVWIHPFDNGNGRTVRLLTYAMLIKQGFITHLGRIINPTAIFCYDRKRYTELLALADKGDDRGLLAWCSYMLGGLKREIEKVDKLSDYEYLKTNLLLPTIDFAQERALITNTEAKILRLFIEKTEVMNSDIQKIIHSSDPSIISRIIKRLKEKGMIVPKEGKKRKYLLRFDNNFLLRGIINSLGEGGFLDTLTTDIK